MAQRAVSLRMTRTVNFAYGADIPLTMDANMSEVVTFATRVVVVRMIVRKRGINWYTMNGPHSIDFVSEFSTLESQFDFGREWGRGSRRNGLQIGRRSQLFDISFQVVGELRHLHLVEGGK